MGRWGWGFSVWWVREGGGSFRPYKASRSDKLGRGTLPFDPTVFCLVPMPAKIMAGSLVFGSFLEGSHLPCRRRKASRKARGGGIEGRPGHLAEGGGSGEPREAAGGSVACRTGDVIQTPGKINYFGGIKSVESFDCIGPNSCPKHETNKTHLINTKTTKLHFGVAIKTQRATHDMSRDFPSTFSELRCNRRRSPKAA